MLLYIYDIKSNKNKRAVNAVKRRFYYGLRKLKYEKRTKSILLVDDSQEKVFDDFFIQFKDFIELYKIRAMSIEKILSADNDGSE